MRFFVSTATKRCLPIDIIEGQGTGSQEFMIFCLAAASERVKIYGFLLSFHTVDFVLAVQAAAKRM